MDIFFKIEKLVKENKITFAELSRNIQIRQSTFSQWKKGMQKPSINNLKKIANYFCVPIEFFLYDKEDLICSKKIRSSKDERILELLKEDKNFSKLIDITINLNDENRVKLLEFAQFQAQKLQSKENK